MRQALTKMRETSWFFAAPIAMSRMVFGSDGYGRGWVLNIWMHGAYG